MTDYRPELDPEYIAEMEDRAADRVDRDWLLGYDRSDRDQARADAAREAERLADRAEFARREAEWDALDGGDHGRHDYGTIL